MRYPGVTRLGIHLVQWALRWKLPVKGLIKKTIFSQFCGGETLEEAGNTARHLGKQDVSAILDYGVEGKSSEADFDRVLEEIRQAILYGGTQKNIPFVSAKITGLARFDLLAKLHRGEALDEAESREWDRVKTRMHSLGQLAAGQGVILLIDAEESWIQKPLDELCWELMESFNQDRPVIFNTYQLYLKNRLEDMKRDLERAKDKGYLAGSKIVRGAYMEKERLKAQEEGRPSPVQPNKEASDRDFNLACRYALDHLDQGGLFIGTHNQESCLLAARYMEEKGLDPHHPRVYFSQLYGMSDHLSFNLAASGYRVSKYLPYGPVEDVMPYLIRRSEENASVTDASGGELERINEELKRRKNPSAKNHRNK